QMAPHEREKALHALAVVCRAHGRTEQAREYLESAVKVANSPDALGKLGDYLAEGKQWKDAAECSRQAWDCERIRPLPLFLAGWALVQSGREKEGQRLIEQAHQLPLGNEI